MGGLALASQQQGFIVSGLDETAGPPMSDWLDENSLNWTTKYSPELLKDVDTIVISGHHGKEDHPIIKEARERNLKILSFAELFGQLTMGKKVIAVAGTHGKTTTTSLIAWIIESAGLKPDYLIGVRPFNFKSSSRLENAKIVVVEADEYKASTLDDQPKFNYYHPDTLILTSIEHDHPDAYPTMDSYLNAFKKLVGDLPKIGKMIVCADDELALEVSKSSAAQVITYSLRSGNFTAKNIDFNEKGISYQVIKNGESLGELTASVYGKHNVANSLAAVAATLNEGLSFDQIKRGAATFKGAFRRFNILVNDKITVIDDYAHHPTEVKTTIEAAKLHFSGRRLIVIYRPHTYSRTQTLLKEYYQAFDGADKLYMCDVEPARELANQRTVSGQEIIDGLPDDLKNNSVFVPDRSDLVTQVVENSEPGDVILSMTVSGYDDVANELASKVR